MINRKRKISELALLKSLSDLAKNLKPSRTRKLCENVSKKADKFLQKMSRITDNEKAEFQALFEKFGESTGWANKEKSLSTYVSFCCELTEKSEMNHDQSIVAALSELALHMEGGGNLLQPNCWAGALAYEKWLDLVEVL